MFQRIVCFKFREDATEADIQQHMDLFDRLKEHIEVIQSYSAGQVISGDSGENYDSVHYLTFKTLDDIDHYVSHSAHQHFVRVNKHLWTQVLVLNAPIETGA